MIYPQYAALGVEYDPRYVVFLAPHNMKGAEAVKNPKVLSPGYWGEQGHFGEMCRKAARAGYAGVVPSMENFTYETPHAFDTRWGPEGSAGWDDLLVRVTRLTFREFCARPDLDPEGFRLAVQEAFFGAGASEGAAGDLLDLHRILNRWEGWTWRGGVMKPPAERLDPARLTPEARTAFERETLPALRRLREIRARAAAAAGSETSAQARRSFAEMSHIAGWVLGRWEGKLPAE
jgi:hypothetical protein